MGLFADMRDRLGRELSRREPVILIAEGMLVAAVGILIACVGRAVLVGGVAESDTGAAAFGQFVSGIAWLGYLVGGVFIGFGAVRYVMDRIAPSESAENQP